QQLPYAFRAVDVRRRYKLLLENFVPPLRLVPPGDLFGEIMPPDSVTRGWIIDPRRSQFGFDFDPFLCAWCFAELFFRRELTRSDCLYDGSRALPRDVHPTSLKSKRT